MLNRKVVLLVALALFALPQFAAADGVTFGFTGGQLTVVQPANSSLTIIGSVASNSSSPATLHYVSRFSGNTIPSGPLVAPNGAPLPPQIAPTFGVYPAPFPLTTNFGSVTWTTGGATATTIGANSSSNTYGAGGSILITGNGGAVGSGTLFSGVFSGPTTFASIGAPKNPTCSSCNFWYSLTGQLSGTVDPGLLALLGLPGGTSTGLFYSFIVGFIGPNDTVGNVESGNLSVLVSNPVPEPGTLALFGTGLVALAAFVRRRMSRRAS